MITVASSGARTLIQDHGRPTHAHLGVPSSGAADPYSHTLANRLVGNSDDTAALEVALHGPTLNFTVDTTVAYVGADTDLTLDHARVPVGHTLPVRAGQTLTVGTLRDGTYGYLAVAGGIASPAVLGSRSTCTLSGLGPAPLATGDVLPLHTHDARPEFQATQHTTRPGRSVRYVPGPHGDLFPADSMAGFTDAAWAISAASSRVGVRLTGTPLAAPTRSLPSLGMVRGAIQVPPSGEPIVLGPDHGATGGYPVLGVVVPADLAALAQLLPGQRVRFRPVSLAEAEDVERATAETMARSLIRLEQIPA